MDGFYPQVMVFCKKDDSGKWIVNSLDINYDYLLDIELLDAIIDACKADKERYPTNEIRDAFRAKWEKEDEIKDIERARIEKEQARERSKTPISKSCHIYVIRDTIRGFHKIGQSKNYLTRFKTLKSANPCVEVVLAYSGIFEDEGWFHEHFTRKGKHIGGEWFELNESDIEEILLILQKHNRQIIYQKAA